MKGSVANMKKRITSLLLVLLLVVSVMPVASANEVQMTPYASDYLSGCAITIVPAGNRKITVEYTIYGTREMTEIGATKVQIQKYDTTKGAWVNYTSLAGSSTSDDVSHSASVSFYGTAGVEYRAVIYAYAERGAGSGSSTYDSSGVVCK
jgi:PhoPQ-activated pathogenicity-related protein